MRLLLRALCAAYVHGKIGAPAFLCPPAPRALSAVPCSLVCISAARSPLTDALRPSRRVLHLRPPCTRRPDASATAQSGASSVSPSHAVLHDTETRRRGDPRAVAREGRRGPVRAPPEREEGAEGRVWVESCVPPSVYPFICADARLSHSLCVRRSAHLDDVRPCPRSAASSRSPGVGPSVLPDDFPRHAVFPRHAWCGDARRAQSPAWSSTPTT